MALTATTGIDPGAIETLLKDDLFHADQVIVHMGPILRHLLRNDDSSIFSDEVIARVRGMLADIARQLIQALGEAAGHSDAAAWAREAGPGMVDILAGHQALLNHLHMLAVEWQLAEKLQSRLGIDPVLTPLLQDIIASPDHDLAARGMNLLAAQARFGQAIRRMQLPLTELPDDLHHIAILTMHGYVADDPSGVAAAELAEVMQRKLRSETASRLDLLAYAISATGAKPTATLSLQNAGVALFLTALSLGTGLPRETAIMSTTESQMPRLALSLAGAGLGKDGLTETFNALHPDITLPDGLAQLHPDRALALLASAHYSDGV
ncbi:MAG: hypothetical protein B7Y89_05910 [Novosphingobium sp. 32-60-15]|uniref:hypothetical protein n=1 Tax=unclassified Novosphingobium TaxID=2644732 RepID=UPI000BDB6244|nr:MULTISPECIES: hypothetical protein [unclassified Novosphingobium]OYX63450.1 MAG: hypothetical protein B7Y89_05910 [Novosphingobium sp. 32-60-15]